MRIIAGSLGGRRIRAPRGSGTRPTPERVREAVFSALGPLRGRAVLDLFAGSGALGLEALSRGAEHAAFVERSPAALAAVRRNVRDLGVDARSSVRGVSWRQALRADAAAEIRYDIAFLDPPYDRWPEIQEALGGALVSVLAPGGRAIAEHPATEVPNLSRMQVERRRTYGDTGITELTVAPR